MYNQWRCNTLCRCDGIGRRSGLKIRRWRQRTGSSLVTGTTSEQALYRLLRFFLAKIRAHSLHCSSFPNHNRYRWVVIWSWQNQWLAASIVSGLHNKKATCLKAGWHKKTNGFALVLSAQIRTKKFRNTQSMAEFFITILT